MKLYTAGLYFNRSLDHLTHDQKIDYVIEVLPRIQNEAISCLGKDVTVLVLLHEYEFTPKAITNEQKKACLKKLEDAVGEYRNLILIPGSFAAYDNLHKPRSFQKQKLKKIASSYKKLQKNPLYDNDELFTESLKEFSVVRMFKGCPINSLQNSSYIMTAEYPPIKHKKSFPISEANRLKDKITLNCFNIGSDNPIKTVSVKDHEFKLGLIICREHSVITDKSDEVKKNLPPLQVLISASIPVVEDDLFGAVTIHMDSISKLNVYINDSHPHSQPAVFTQVEADCYQFKLDNGQVVCDIDSVKPQHFSKDIKKAEPEWEETEELDDDLLFEDDEIDIPVAETPKVKNKILSFFSSKFKKSESVEKEPDSHLRHN